VRGIASRKSPGGRHNQAVLSRRAFVAGLGCALLPSPLLGQQFFERQTLRVLIGTDVGGSADRASRVVARGLSERFPHARFSVETKPKAGGRIAVKELAEAKPDGLTIGYVPTGLIYSQLTNEPGAAFDLARFRWIVSVSAEHRVLLVSKKLGIRSIEELVAHGAPVGVPARSASSSSYFDPLLLNVVLGTKLRPVPGFSSVARPAALLAGEAAAIVASYEAVASLIESGEVEVLLRLGRAKPPPALAGVRALAELATEPAHRDLVDILQLPGDFGRCVAAPPDTPDERVAALRTLHNDLFADPQFLSVAARAGVEISPTPGEILETEMKRLFAGASAARAERLAAAFACGKQQAEGGASC
jgi:tripartite-type tricarboxylate transporter receptor subunit TctC